MKTFVSAFPINESAEDGRGSWNIDAGITMRDYFAAAALTGLFANVQAMEHLQADEGENLPHAIADRAYLLADAMIGRRNQ